jgi:hypothetical protein
MKFKLEVTGILDVEKLFYESNTTSEEKMLLVFLHNQKKERNKEELDLEEIQQDKPERITELLFKLQLKGYIRVENGSVTLLFGSDEQKQCSKCGEPKLPDEFYNNSTAPDGKDNYCKECRNAINRDRDENPEEKRAYEREYKAKKTLEERIERVKEAVDELVRRDEEVHIENVIIKTNLQRVTIESYPELGEIINAGIEKQKKIRRAQREAEEARRKNALKYQIDTRSGLMTSVDSPDEETTTEPEEAKQNDYKPEKPFDKMNKKQKVLHMFKTSNLRQKEIADYIGISQGAVSVYKKQLQNEGKI